MPKEPEVREGFSPSQYLLNVLIDSTESSVKTGEWTNYALCQTCTKARGKINVCVAENGQVVMLSVCNSREDKARNAIVVPLPGQNARSLQKEILHSVRQASLGAKLDDSVSGQCLENLNAVQVIQASGHTNSFSVQGGRSEMPKSAGDKTKRLQVVEGTSEKTVAPGDPDRPNVYSRRFPETVRLAAEAEEVYLALLKLRPDHGGKMEEDGTFTMEKAVQLLDGLAHSLGKSPLWWKKGWDMLLDINPHIIERLANGSGIMIHHIHLESDQTTHSSSNHLKHPHCLPYLLKQPLNDKFLRT